MEEQLTFARGLKRSPPCNQCRLRKVKCDKQRPCESCQKSGADCTYNSSHPGISDVESYSELLERVALLEAQLALTSSAHSRNAASHVTIPAATVGSDQSQSMLECNCGRQILGAQFSVHYDYYLNWVELFPELRDIYLDITAANEDLDGPKEACPPILGAVQQDPFALQAYLPLEPEADLLIKIFFQKVNPFIRMLNKKTFFADLARFRAGQLANSNIFVALLFSIFGLAVASLLPSEVSESFGVERGWLLHKYQETQELALHRLDFVNSNKLSVFQAFLYYLVFLFAREYYQTATALVGLAARNAQRLGLHKDPSWFNYSQWVSEWRRRLWNQLILLDQKAIALQGAISMLAFPWDTKIPANANDEAWNTSLSSKPSDTPTITGTFSQMTFTLLKREVLAVLCPLRQSLRSRPYAQQLRHIEAGHEKAQTLFENVDEDMKPLAKFVKDFMEIEFGLLRLMAGEALIRFGQAPPAFNLRHFLAALTLLERVASHEEEPMNSNWTWLYRTEPPLLAIAIVLSHMTIVRNTPYDTRAWTQISLVFDRYIDVTSLYRPPILAALSKFYDLQKSLRARTSLGPEPMHMCDDVFHQSQFNYFISGEEPSIGTVGVGYSESDLFSMDLLSADTTL